MTKRSSRLLALSVAAFLAACAGNAPAAAQTVEAVAVPPATSEAVLSDERVMELARGYVELLHARDYDGLWRHLAPEAKGRFGSVDRFRSEGERGMSEFGVEAVVVSERVEPARVGMAADKLYFRVSRYTGAETPVRLLIGLKNDGSIAGLRIGRVDPAE